MAQCTFDLVANLREIHTKKAQWECQVTPTDFLLNFLSQLVEGESIKNSMGELGEGEADDENQRDW